MLEERLTAAASLPWPPVEPALPWIYRPQRHRRRPANRVRMGADVAAVPHPFRPALRLFPAQPWTPASPDNACCTTARARRSPSGSAHRNASHHPTSDPRISSHLWRRHRRDQTTAPAPAGLPRPPVEPNGRERPGSNKNTYNAGVNHSAREVDLRLPLLV